MDNKKRNLDLRKETAITTRLEKTIDSVVGATRLITMSSRSSADGRLTGGAIGATISHHRRLLEYTTSIYRNTTVPRQGDNMFA